MLKLEEAKEKLRLSRLQLIKKEGYFFPFKQCLNTEASYAFDCPPEANAVGVECWEFDNLWYAVRFYGELRLVKQGHKSLDIADLEDKFPRIPFEDFTKGLPTRYVRNRIYTAFPKLCAFMRLNSGMIDDLVAEHFNIMALLTNADEKVRICAKRYLDQRHS